MPGIKLIMEQWRVYETRELEPTKPIIKPFQQEAPPLEEFIPEPEYRMGPDGHEYVMNPMFGYDGWYQIRYTKSPITGDPDPWEVKTYTELSSADPWWNKPMGTKLPDYALPPARKRYTDQPHPQSIHPRLVDPSPATEASPGKPRLSQPVREVNTNYNMKDMKLILETFREKTQALLEQADAVAEGLRPERVVPPIDVSRSKSLVRGPDGRLYSKYRDGGEPDSHQPREQSLSGGGIPERIAIKQATGQPIPKAWLKDDGTPAYKPYGKKGYTTDVHFMEPTFATGEDLKAQQRGKAGAAYNREEEVEADEADESPEQP